MLFLSLFLPLPAAVLAAGRHRVHQRDALDGAGIAGGHDGHRRTGGDGCRHAVGDGYKLQIYTFFFNKGKKNRNDAFFCDGEFY